MTKTCSKCKETKPVEDFRIHNGYVRGECRACEAAIRKLHYQTDPAKFAAASRKWCRENREHHNATKRAWHAANKAKHKDTTLKRTYGISLGDYENLLALQGGVCAVCKTATHSNCGRALHVDHCHATGKIRGLLCGKCNSLLGFVNDDVKLLDAAKEYLSKV